MTHHFVTFTIMVATLITSCKTHQIDKKTTNDVQISSNSLFKRIQRADVHLFDTIDQCTIFADTTSKGQSIIYRTIRHTAIKAEAKDTIQATRNDSTQSTQTTTSTTSTTKKTKDDHLHKVFLYLIFSLLIILSISFIVGRNSKRRQS